MGTPQLPEEGAAGPAFAHLYIVDPNAANNMRLNFSRQMYEVCDELDETLREHNKVASILERAVQNSGEEN